MTAFTMAVLALAVAALLYVFWLQRQALKHLDDAKRHLAEAVEHLEKARALNAETERLMSR
jgi:Flp pilus assembly protein TadB